MAFRQLVAWLGPQRTRILVTLLVAAGLGSLGLQLAFAGEDWVLSVQLALVWLLLGGVALLAGSRLPVKGQRRLALALVPGLLLLGMGVLLPRLALFFGGAGLGWMVAAQMILRNRMQMETQTAIRHLRRSQYAEAVASIDKLIAAEPDTASHVRFRAEIYRLWGKLPKAIKDYERVIRLDPESPAGYTGLAEVYTQQGDYERAREYALQAQVRAPHQWMTAYNLGLIEDRLHNASAAVESLERAWTAGIPHSRYRLLTRLWLARNTYRQGRMDNARQQLVLMRKQASGLRDWQVVFESEQAAALRELLEPDVQLAQRLLAANASLDLLEGG